MFGDGTSRPFDHEGGQAPSLRVLVVEDDAKVRDVLVEMLHGRVVACPQAGNLAAARAELARRSAGYFDVILLDLVLPDGTGRELLRGLRDAGDATPVIIVSSVHDVEQRILALQLGADDYVVKPFTAEELLARVEAVVRRSRRAPVLVQADLRLSLGDRRVERAGRAVELTPREFEVLRALMEARGRPVSRTRLLRDVWGLEHEPGTTIVEVLVGRLRRKLERHGPVLLRTVPGEGYCLGREPDPARADR